MKPKHHFDTHQATQRNVILIWGMIGDLDRRARPLDCDIATEEERVGISNRSDAAYPVLARTLPARRDNLRDTISALEKRLSNMDQAKLVMELA
jgi:hypothetical protein